MRKRVRTRQRSAKDKLIEGAVAEDYRAHAAEDFEFFVQTVLDVFLGRFREWVGSGDKYDHSAERRIIDRAMGIHKARLNQIPKIGPMLIESVAPVLVQLSKLFQTPMSKHMKQASDSDLQAARDEWNTLLGLFAAIAPVLEWTFGKHAFAFGNASQFLGAAPRSEALAILLWYLARSHFVNQGQVGVILGLQSDVTATVQAFEKLHKLAEANPEYREVIQPKRIRGAIRNARKRAAVVAELQQLNVPQPDTE